MDAMLKGNKIWNDMLGYMDPTHTEELANGTYLDVVLFVPDTMDSAIFPDYDTPGTTYAFCSLLVKDGQAHMVGVENVDGHQVVNVLELPSSGGFFVRGSDYRRTVFSIQLSNTVIREALKFGIDLDLSEDIDKALDGIHPILPTMHMHGIHMRPIRAQDALLKVATPNLSSGR